MYIGNFYHRDGMMAAVGALAAVAFSHSFMFFDKNKIRKYRSISTRYSTFMAQRGRCPSAATDRHPNRPILRTENASPIRHFIGESFLVDEVTSCIRNTVEYCSLHRMRELWTFDMTTNNLYRNRKCKLIACFASSSAHLWGASIISS